MVLLEQAIAATQPANPLLPFLPPDLAEQALLSRYSMIGACSVLIWDVLDNLRADRRLIRDYSIRFPTVVYFVSRIGALGFALSSVITVNLADICKSSIAKVLLGFFYPISAPSTSLLFLIRLRAVYNYHRGVSIVFTFLWLMLFAASMLFPFGFVLINIDPGRSCFVLDVHEFIIAPVVISVVYDTLVLLAVSWKLMHMENTHTDRNIRTGFRMLIFGDYLPAFSRAFLQDAQLYYAITVPVSMVTAITFFIPNSSLVVRVMFTLPNNVLLNIMACRVFRKTKLGLCTPDPDVSKSAFMEGTINDFQITA
ncbi:hypothetical protein BJ165DRAFT_1346363 [Panaeolus papilionaceus]|nr:hypothetical protein BJ165DRAFT_1346363 [Panaeolus papilionaceus]